MSISINTNSPLIQSGEITLNPQQIKKTDEAFMALFDKKKDDPATILSEIAGGGVEGMMKWKIRKLEQEIAAKVLASKNLTVEQVQAMPDKQRVALEQQIMREVAEKLKQAMNEEMKKQNKTDLGYFNSQPGVNFSV